MALSLARTLRLLAAEKKAVLKRQSALVASLNRLLPSIGYRVVPHDAEGQAVNATPPRPRRRIGSPAGGKAPRGKPLSCPHCSRTFALPLHLGRHISVMHKPTKAPATPSTEGGETPTTQIGKPTRRSSKSPSVRKAAARARRAARPKRAGAKKAKRASASLKKARG